MPLKSFLFHWFWTGFFCLLCSSAVQAESPSISIDHREGKEMAPVLRHAIDDVKSFLGLAFGTEIGENDADAFVHFQLSPLREANRTAPTDFSKDKGFPYFHYPAHHFRWISRPLSNRVFLQLDSPTAEGMANGLYALLQEKLGFSFAHPRQTVVPCHEQWPLPTNLVFEGRPRFDKKGFHLHTQHPLELTEPLHDPDFKGGQQMVREYIDWLARNGQNFFEFCLLETVDLKRWIPYARSYVAYAHDRGVLCSVDLSLHMVQQNAFKLVRFAPASFRSFETQIDRRLDDLLSVGFDFVNMEFSVAEFVGGMEKMRNRLRQHVVDRIKEYPGVKLLGRQHVVRAENEFGGSGKHQTAAADPQQGLLVHTVMCYALTDSAAPVYELDNFQHQLKLLEAENKQRETWFYPESAYWITFDNSVPMLHLPYLSARFRDIQTAEELGIPGHVTFSSGWEWGYWLVDWSIARWSWVYGENGKTLPQAPLSCLSDLVGNGQLLDQFTHMLDLQEAFLVRENGLRYLCPPNFADELPASLNKQFQPRPGTLPQDMFRDFAPEHDRELEQAALGLARYGQKLGKYLRATRLAKDPEGMRGILYSDLYHAIEISVAYAFHQSNCWAAFREIARGTGDGENFLVIARKMREGAQKIVQEMEPKYRYPVELLARPLESHSSYDFGYLYPVSNLHLWERREAQLEEKTFDDPFFMNIWDPLKIAGLKK